MANPSKTLRAGGVVLLLIFVVVLGYACYGEHETRAHAPSGANFGPLPLDLLLGRRHFEDRENGKVVWSLDTGPMAEGRIALARTAFGIGVVGGGLLAAGIALGRKARTHKG